MAPANSHQTVRLAAGRHRTPASGACVMELASLLAEERFSDCPISVCPVIGGFLRPYNDGVDDDRRQDLYAVAARVVGTTGGARVRRRRARHLRRRLIELSGGGRWRSLVARFQFGDVLGSECAVALLLRDDHEGALRLVEELIAIGGDASPGDVPRPAGTDRREAALGRS